MKNTESIDETVTKTALSLADDQVVSVGDATLDQRRRRLVRGAMAAAPLVLTLRSGALAAASCTGAISVDTTIGNNGKPGAGSTGDVCIPIADAPLCPTSNNKLKNLPGTTVGYPIGNDGKCPPLTTQGTHVAILSSHAYSSFQR
jgi:hypothetical protein